MSTTPAGEAIAPPSSRPYVGRFAPSPTGPLHFGSLLGALASFLDAHAASGRWLVRIEDIDPLREQPGATRQILATLASHGLQHDGELLFQSQRTELYRAAADALQRNGMAYRCHCSRSWLARHGGIHPATCQPQADPGSPAALRLAVQSAPPSLFEDRVQGQYQQLLARDVGDFVIWRKEDLPAYQLAVVIDDDAQGVTDVVRGSDLLDNTPRQQYLQQQLGLRQLRYAHIPVIADRQGQKLSKQTFARPLDDAAALDNLLAALDYLGQQRPRQPRSVAALLRWAVDHWRIEAVPRRLALAGDELPPSCRLFAS